jgi:hypothetical protein
VVVPSDSGCRRYLARMALGADLDRLGVDHDLGSVPSRELDSLCELRWFGDEEELEAVAETVVRQYQDSGAAVVQPLYQALFEMAVNAVRHSGRGGGYVALQSFLRVEEVAFAIADSGVGLRSRLCAASDGQAIDTGPARSRAPRSAKGCRFERADRRRLPG